jgi:hypothetical protein
MKLTPRLSLVGSAFGGVAFCGRRGFARNQCGRANSKTPSKESTRAEWLRDFRKPRRDEDKRLLPGSVRLVLEFAPASLIFSEL